MEENHIFQGLRRDNHQIKQPKEFLWDAHNIRLTNRDDSTLLSITNERGPKPTGLTFEGGYVGHCTVGKYLILFTAIGIRYHYIYRIEREDNNYKYIRLFYHNREDSVWNEGWDTNHPIEAIGVYETELVQKVYWIDGKNQPRVINVAKPELKEVDPEEFYLSEYAYKTTDFDFVQTLKLEEEVYVTELRGNGMFAPGVIQYAFTYYNKYGAESNIFYTTELQYITYPDRGGSPEDRITTSFKIKIDNVDSFEYLRVYSIHRTSIDSVPTVKLVSDIEITSNYVEVIDTGTIGEIVDPTYLIYVGGRNIVPHCITQKDGTLFFGNIELREDEGYLELKSLIKKEENIQLDTIVGAELSYKSSNGLYYNYNICPNIRGFKSNEYYRIGVQFQKSNGVWTEPIFIKDDVLNTSFPYINELAAQWLTKKLSLTTIKEELNNRGYKKVRGCVVFPSTSERTVLCQGVICPTVFSTVGRKKGGIFAMSSWFFRPGSQSDLNPELASFQTGDDIQYVHNRTLLGGQAYNGTGQVEEISGTGNNCLDIDKLYNPDAFSFLVDENIVTMHSPDIEFDTSMYFLDLYKEYNLHILGFIQLGAISGDINIQTSTPTFGTATGFKHSYQGYKVGQGDCYSNGGLIAGLYRDEIVGEDFTSEDTKYYIDFVVSAFNHSGSLNNDTARPSDKGTRTAILSKKVISNLKYFNKFTSIKSQDNTIFNIQSPKLFSSNEVTLEKVWVPYLGMEVPYMGNIDTLITFNDLHVDVRCLYNGKVYPLEEAYHLESNSTSTPKFTTDICDPVRLKYKSTPHLVFALGKDNDNTSIYLPPISENNGVKVVSPYTIPKWDSLSNIPSSNPFDNPIDVGCIYPVEPDRNTIGKYVLIPAEGNKYTLGYMKTIRQSNTVPVRRTGVIVYPPLSSTIKVGTIIRIEGDGTVLTSTSTTLVDTTHIEDVKVDSSTGKEYGKFKGETLYFKITSITKEEDHLNISIEKYAAPLEDSDSTRGENNSTFTIKRYEVPSSEFNSKHPYLCLAELRREIDPKERFGGDNDYILKSHLWYPASAPVNIEDDIIFSYGDTWYQRYDCLKTYPFTHEDENQIVEIGSFMCETRVNIDGRYDRNRGQLSNLQMTPQNFNLINEVYSQKDNFFNYRILDSDYYKNNKYSHQVIWSLEKQAGSDVDKWTQITMANTLDMDGTKGAITKLDVFNETLICLQEKAFSTILFNSRVQIPVSDGVPVEISNGYKVDGYRFINDSIGCQNKWSACGTMNRYYFIDDNTDTLWAYTNEGPVNMTDALGMKWWFKKNHSSVPWKPSSNLVNGIRTFYDPTYGDIYFTPGPEDNGNRDALCYSEQLGQFVSQYSYGGTQAMLPFNEEFISFRRDKNELETVETTLWENFKGEYNTFFDGPKGWDFSFISNDNSTLTKIFDTLEIRADSFNPKLVGDKYSTKVQTGQPFDFIKVENEYQDTDIVLFNASTLRKKFRVWRALLPRANRRERIRNPWAMVTLGCKNPGTKLSVIHDVSVKYTI